MATRQTFKTLDVLRLLVERDPEGTELRNELDNGDAALGAYGWVGAPAPGQTLEPYIKTENRPAGAAGRRFKWSTAGGVSDEKIISEPIFLVAGQWIAARWLEDVPMGLIHHKARFEFYDANGGTLLIGAYTNGFRATVDGTARATAPLQAPAGTNYCRLVYSPTGNAAGTAATPVGETYIYVRSITVGIAATSAGVNSGALAGASRYYVDVAPDCLEIVYNRVELDVSTLTARINSAALDPLTSTVLRPGRRLMLEAMKGGAWSPLFTGSTASARTSYTQTRAGLETVIELTGVDAGRVMAMTGAPDMYRANQTQGTGASEYVWADTASFADLMSLAIEPIPWNCDGYVDNPYVLTRYSGTDDSCTLLDNAIRTRDGRARGAGWVSKAGVFHFVDHRLLADMPLVDTLTEADYARLEVDYDTAEAVNSLTITNWFDALPPSDPDYKGTVFGPYKDSQSIRRWGELRANYSAFGFGTPADVRAHARLILNANKDPLLLPDSVSKGLSTTADIDRWAHRELVDKVRVTSTAPALDRTCRVQGIEQRITPDRWTVTYRLRLDGRLPLPTV